MHTNDPKLTTANAAPYCGYSERHFIRMRQQGEGPPYLRLKGKVFYRQSDLDAWLDSKRVVPPRETELLREEG
ncbi:MULTISPECIES: helix-turn-helix domain-containing protein [Halorhodospira]|uniref:helix-turn-helix domain-containing protein n=1 Tax=Halorhodospira TaxID=85108 RepID=UPI001EE97231|nr:MULTISPECIES: helix-turn-helix domain-containing protein [Halorhodospira]MCG5528589.1 helix-turn-helix domain-containing protein [Halorhodospira halophila]MCG5543748.1 helix-turn-helix domain-containing protein [Halorhodospira sp. 9628]